MQFLGRREKWSFGGQLGHGFYKDDYGLKAGIYYSISCNYRAILSERLLFTTSLSLGYRNFHYGKQIIAIKRQFYRIKIRSCCFE
jgi:hypothetical protein